MPDISLCANYDCKQKDNCYRWRAEPKAWQAYMNYKPENNDVGEAFKCEAWISHRNEQGELRHDLR